MKKFKRKKPLGQEPPLTLQPRDLPWKTAAERDQEWINAAVKYTATIRYNVQNHTKHDIPTLAEAAWYAKQMEKIVQQNPECRHKQASVYGINAEEHFALVPRDQWEHLA